jgi:hypothetical protein
LLRLLLALVALLASDTFDRANANPIGSPWTTASGESAMQIVSNACTPSTLANDCAAYHSTIAWPADQYSKAKLSVTGTAGGKSGPTLKVRQASGARTCYQLEVDHAATANVNVDKVVAGAFTSLTGFPLTLAWTDGDTWELRAIGTTISVYRNGVLVGSAVDSASPITSGNPGIGYSSTETSASIDNWEGGDFAGATPVTIPLNWALKKKPQFDTTVPAVVSSSSFRRTLHPFGAGKGKRTKGR